MAQFPCGVPQTAWEFGTRKPPQDPKPWCPRIRCKVSNGSEPAFRFYCSRPAENRTATAALEPLFALYTRCILFKYARPGWVVAAHGSKGAQGAAPRLCNVPPRCRTADSAKFEQPGPRDRAPDIRQNGLGKRHRSRSPFHLLASSMPTSPEVARGRAGASHLYPEPASGPRSPPSGVRVAGATTLEVAPIV